MLDSTSYLTSFGWQGKGNGLRQGSVSRPLSIPQKRTLAGLGKDRDEAFPFWDHLFSAAAKSIKIKVSQEDDTEADGPQDNAAFLTEPSLLRTATGILSTRRPVLGTPASSGSVTPADSTLQTSMHLTLMATAKRESARKRLYARFFKGPVLGPEINSEKAIQPETLTVPITNCDEQANGKRKHEDPGPRGRMKGTKKGKRRDVSSEKIGKKPKKQRKDSEDEQEHNEPAADGLLITKRIETDAERRQRKADKAERRRRKEERRKLKAKKN
ncbi:hypothetical protein K439DRAFT_1637240 [Ramaria rubella]|nr:hypothetical protein K439DRAFT_1637240 [Ramaria rubella]